MLLSIMFWFTVALVFILIYIFSLFYINGSKKPGEPEFKRGWFPYIGVFFEIVRKGYYPFVLECQKSYGEIFSFYFLGIRTHILTNYKDFGQIQKNPKSFSLHPIMETVSIREKNVPHSDEKKKIVTREFSKSFQGNSLNELTKDYQIQSMKRIEEIFKEKGGNETIEVNLYDFSRSVVYYGSTKAFLGEQFDCALTEDPFFKYDSTFQLIFIGLPIFFLKSSYEARQIVIDHIKSLDVEKMSAFIKETIYASADSEEITKEHAADIAFGALLASQVNSVNGAFWGFLNILNNPDVRKEVEKEIKEKFKFEEYEKSLNEMQYLHACFTETTRFNTIGISLRAATKDEKINVNGKDYKIRKGDQLLIIPTEYENPEIFPNPEKFDPSRFLIQDPKKQQIFKEVLLPFGGGVHYCPGRNFAINEMKVLTILMLTEFDCQLSASNPEIKSSRTQLGFQKPLYDLKIEITRKKK
jgi:(+)-abscisic acid 8'-hydroxylase